MLTNRFLCYPGYGLSSALTGLAKTALMLPAGFASGDAEGDESQLSRAEAEALHPDMLWDLKQLGYGGDADETKLKEDLKTLSGLCAELAGYKGRLGESAQTLLAFLKTEWQAIRLISGLGEYVMCLASVDQGNTRSQELVQLVDKAEPELNAALSFAESELVVIGSERLHSFMENEELKIMRRQFERLLANAEHIREPAVEEALALLGADFLKVPEKARGHLSDNELGLPQISVGGQQVQLSQANFVPLFLRNPDRDVRAAGFAGMFDALGSKRLTFGDLYRSAVGRNEWLARVHRYDEGAAKGDMTLTSILGPNQIPVSLFDGLINAVETRGLSSMTTYLELRSKVLGHKLGWHDLYTAMFGRSTKRFTPAEAQKILLAALAPLGEEYLGYVREFFEKRRIDFFVNKGKDPGAYLANATGNIPLLFINWMGTIEDLFTLAHELGHGVHHVLYSKSQPLVYASCAVETAETASISNEHLLARYLLANETDVSVRLEIVEHMVEAIRLTLFRQMLFSSFERKVHSLAEQGQPLTADKLCEIWLGLNKLYYEREGVCEIDARVGIEWARIPHLFFLPPYYVYTYAMGTVNGASMVAQLDKDPQGAVARHLQFLNAGTSMAPLDLLRIERIDWSDPAARVEETLALFDGYIAQLEQAFADQHEG